MARRTSALLLCHCLLAAVLFAPIHGFAAQSQIRRRVSAAVQASRPAFHEEFHHEEVEEGVFASTPERRTRSRARRQLITGTLGALCGWIGASPKFYTAFAADNVLVRGTVTVPSEFAATTTDTALYITCRPNRPDNVPRAILDGTSGKPPPVLTARLPAPLQFPLEFQLTAQDVTPEGQSGGNGAFWWQQDPLVVSARLDTDGVAATRSPDDLVGRTLYTPNLQAPLELTLSGRGAFGKFATKKS